jgi:hypothetical protein
MKWEYKTLKYEASGFFSQKIKTEPLDEELNQLGAEGWELVAALHPTTGATANIFLFKRPRQD